MNMDNQIEILKCLKLKILDENDKNEELVDQIYEEFIKNSDEEDVDKEVENGR